MTDIPSADDLSFDDQNVAIFDTNPGETRRLGTQEPFASPIDTQSEWLSSTPSTNPNKPRTLAAGYDPTEQIMTVVFRDGIWWNYYGVPQELWNNFKAAPSPGHFMKYTEWTDGRTLDTWGDMGRASFEGLTPQLRTYVKRLGLGGGWARYRGVYTLRGARRQR